MRRVLAAVGVLVALVAVSCAAPQADLGHSGQGGSAAAPLSTVTINFGEGSHVEVTSAPTAAPAATSTATSSQRADNKVTPSLALGDKAIDAASDILKPVPKLGDTKPPSPPPIPETK